MVSGFFFLPKSAVERCGAHHTLIMESVQSSATMQTSARIKVRQKD